MSMLARLKELMGFASHNAPTEVQAYCNIKHDIAFHSIGGAVNPEGMTEVAPPERYGVVYADTSMELDREEYETLANLANKGRLSGEARLLRYTPFARMEDEA